MLKEITDLAAKRQILTYLKHELLENHDKSPWWNVNALNPILATLSSQYHEQLELIVDTKSLTLRELIKFLEDRYDEEEKTSENRESRVQKLVEDAMQMACETTRDLEFTSLSQLDAEIRITKTIRETTEKIMGEL